MALESMITVAEGWQSFREAVLPKDMSPNQYEICEQVFYGASTWALAILMRIAELPLEDSEQAIAALENELENFAIRQKRLAEEREGGAR